MPIGMAIAQTTIVETIDMIIVAGKRSMIMSDTGLLSWLLP